MSCRRLIGRPTDVISSAGTTGGCGRLAAMCRVPRILHSRSFEMLRLPRLVPLMALAAAPGFLTNISKAQSGGPPRVEAVRYWSFGDVTRIAVQTHGDYRFTSDQVERPSRIYFDLNGLRPPTSVRKGVQTIRVGDQRVKQIRVAEVRPGKTRLVFDLEGPAEVIASQLVNPDRLMIEIRPKGTSLPALAAGRTGAPAIRATAGVATRPVTDLASSGERTPAREPLTATTPDDRPLATSRITTIQRADGLVVQQVYTRPIASVATPPAPFAAPPTSASAPSVLPSRAIVPASSSSLVPPPAPAPTTLASSKVIGVAAPAKKDSAGDRSLVRVFGLKMGKVVIDAGHGGHDTGTIGPHGLMEKNLVLDVALRLGALITQQLGAQVVYTRSDDTFIPLEERTKIANRERADLFISIHANSSPEPSASGVETYFFNLTSDKSGLDLATRENATSASSISDLSDMLHRAVLEAKLEESREFAQTVQTSLWAGSVKMDNRSRDRGVRQAPFVVLIGATMPSILAEIGFVSNPHDEKLLGRGEQRERIAQALFKGVSRYAGTLSHADIASSGAR